jgi:hypothetical protein
MFVNDRRIDGVPSLAILKQQVDEALLKKGETVAKKD